MTLGQVLILFGVIVLLGYGACWAWTRGKP